ncbi:hypothetical protein NKR19_g4494 [Coniochaeta hoffmannii]|uniref:Pentatricopeptide repeat domain-containing protein n=1 Tax=Coniochaeta hoffmannii TaxID=91930 RepID=A0AA38SA99_9PEZI|nr:hypothetical protein NKR19_g4494 [Coniochaeta hoffmannii]
MEYPHPRETLLNDHMHRREVDAQKRHDVFARENHQPVPNWRRVLQELTAATPRYMNGVVRVLMPPVASDALLDPDRENSLWDIRSRTHCYMVVERERDPDGNTVLKISGTRTAVENAIDDIVHVVRKVKVLLVSGTGETVVHDGIERESGTNLAQSGGQISIGPTRSLNELLKPTLLATTAHDIPRPNHWTKQTFEQYVATLTRGRLPQWAASKLYPRRRLSHQHAVVKELIDVFYDPETQASLSSAAFKIALEYLSRRGRTFRPQVRVLFDRLEKLGIPTDTAIFNFLLEASTADRDLRSFSTCVFLMIRRGHEPNIRTWLLFLRLIQSEEVRRYILQAMIHRNLLVSSENLARVAHEMAAYDAERAMQRGLDLATLLVEQSHLYGPDWLNHPLATATCNRIVTVIAKHGKWDMVDQFIDFMASRPSPYVYPNAHTLSVLVEHARVQTYARSAIHLVARFEQLGVAPNRDALRSLFMAFRYHNMVHAADATWQYALLTAKTSSDMATRYAELLELGRRLGWDAAGAEGDIPTTRAADMSTLPTKGLKQAKQYAAYALLLASSRDVFGVRNPAAQDNLLRTLRDRGVRMRFDGCGVAPGVLSGALAEAAERDSRFHRGLGAKRWVVEPAVLPTTAITGSGPLEKADVVGDEGGEEDEADEGVGDGEASGEEIPAGQTEKNSDIEI